MAALSDDAGWGKRRERESSSFLPRNLFLAARRKERGEIKKWREEKKKKVFFFLLQKGPFCLSLRMWKKEGKEGTRTRNLFKDLRRGNERVTDHAGDALRTS